MSELKLNLGCGGNSKHPFHNRDCDVNADLERPIQKIPNFVRSDAHYLPFREKVFDELKAYHLIEHLVKPQDAIKEMTRVSSKVVMVFPHYFSPDCYLDKFHRWIIIKNRFIRNPNLTKKIMILACRALRKTRKILHLELFTEQTWITKNGSS